MVDIYDKIRAFEGNIAIRSSVWETNSSSVHSMVILPKEKYKQWENGLYLFLGRTSHWSNIYPFLDSSKYPVEDALYTKEEVTEFLKMDGFEDDLNDLDDDYGFDELAQECEFYSFNVWGGCYEWDEEEYTTESGDEIVIRSYFGYDG